METKSEISSRELMDEVVARSALELIQAIKRACGNNDNSILRLIKSIHGNTTKSDLPEELQVEIKRLSQAMFGYINGKGHVLVPKDSTKR